MTVMRVSLTVNDLFFMTVAVGNDGALAYLTNPVAAFGLCRQIIDATKNTDVAHDLLSGAIQMKLYAA